MVQAAERAILPRFRQLEEQDIREKTTDELVTIADVESEEILSEGLASILPEAAIVGEESVDRDGTLSNLLRERLCWIIDPLDGTANYAAGHGPFGILVALAEQGKTLGGWIYDPRTGRFVAAFKGAGTWIDGARVHSRASGQTPPIAAISALLAPLASRAALVAEVGRHYKTVPIPRCAAEQYPAMILGRSDVTLFERTLAWDHAAGIICLIEAGGMATRFDGSEYRADDDLSGLIAAATAEQWRTAFGHINAVA